MERYEKQITLIGSDAQEQLRKKTVTIIGVGAIGTVAAEQLTRSGIGKLVLIDHDIVELSNLQRQSLYYETDINKPKAEVAREKLKKINSEVEIEAHPINLSAENINKLTAGIILDCTDNLETRFLINEHCKRNNIPWIHSAAAGSIGVVLPITNSYCFNCIFSNAKNALTCDDLGI